MKAFISLFPALLLILACNPSSPTTNRINRGACTVGLTKAPVGGSDTLYIPNIFTPDGDGVNDIHLIEVDTTKLNLSRFQMVIEDPIRVEVYRTTDPFYRWEGQNSEGEPLRSALYEYFLDVTVNGVAYSFNGQITLIKPIPLYEEEFDIINCSQCKFPDQISSGEGFVFESNQRLGSICE